MQDGKICHVNAVHVAGDGGGGGPDIGRVVVADVKHPVAFMLVCTEQLRL